MTGNDSSLHWAGGTLGRRCHVCAFFNSTEEEHRVLRSFFKDGFDQGQKAFHVVDPELREDHLKRLAGAGINVQQGLRSGQLEVLPWKDAYLREERFDQDAMLLLIEEAIKASVATGYPLTRILGHMEWALLDKPGVEDLLEYEARLNYVLPKYDHLAICSYDVSKFPASLLLEIMRTHPVVIIGGAMQENPFFVPPDQFLHEIRQRRAVGETPTQEALARVNRATTLGVLGASIAHELNQPLGAIVASAGTSSREFSALRHASRPPGDLPDLQPVRASWQRSAERYHIAQGSRQAPWIQTAQELSVSRAPVDELIGIAADENDRLFTAVGKVGYALLFTTADGVVVDVRGDPARIRQFKHWGIWQGGVWAESVEGTNGIGTCIAEKAPVTVHCSHHFRARHAPLSCCGAPVFDPNQNLVAVVDVSSYEPELSERSRALAFALTVEAARSIEERLFRHVHRRAWILSAIAPRRPQPVLLAVENDERVVGADRHARAALDIDDRQLSAGLSLWRFFYRSPSLVASKSGDGFVKLTRLGDPAPWHVVFTPPLPPRATPLDLRPRIPTASGGAALTARERGILELVAQGQSNKQIARTLGISPETVKTHLDHVYGKLAVERRAQAIARAKDLALLAT
jgi:DNA-binding CsgD family transcriptional regulator/signal transduction histidine kinase